jgi:hypothetical protein
MRQLLIAVCALALLATTSCSGLRTSENGNTVVHAECFRLFGLAIPGDDQQRATELAQQHIAGEPISQISSPADWTSVVGIFGNLFGFHQTLITGVAAQPAAGGE